MGKTKFFSLLIFLSFLSCQKENLSNELNENNNSNVRENKLLGKWNWVKSYSKHSQTVSNPSTEGYSLKVEFTDYDTAYFYINDSLYQIKSYYLSDDTTYVDTSNTVTTIRFDSIQAGYLYWYGDTLVLDYSNVDKLIEYYVK